MVLIGYSGHSFVLCDILKNCGIRVEGYCEREEKIKNPFNLYYLGKETSKKALGKLSELDYFIAVGDNSIRRKIRDELSEKGIAKNPVNVIDPSAYVSSSTQLKSGIMVGPNASLNAFSAIDHGVVCNTGCIIEHEVSVGEYSFIAPGAIVLGGAKIGKNCFIGAGSVVLQNVVIGHNSLIGAGSIVVKDIPPNSKVVGNPSRFI